MPKTQKTQKQFYPPLYITALILTTLMVSYSLTALGDAPRLISLLPTQPLLGSLMLTDMALLLIGMPALVLLYMKRYSGLVLIQSYLTASILISFPLLFMVNDIVTFYLSALDPSEVAPIGEHEFIFMMKVIIYPVIAISIALFAGLIVLWQFAWRRR